MARKRILLVEDCSDDLLLIQRVLRRCPSCDIEIARDGVSALERLQLVDRSERSTSADLPHVVLLDLKLPRLSGFDVLHRIRSDHRTRNLPVVVFSTSSEQEDILNSYRSGANSYVRKTIDFEQFSNSVRTVVQYWTGINVTAELEANPEVGEPPVLDQSQSSKSSQPH